MAQPTGKRIPTGRVEFVICIAGLVVSYTVILVTQVVTDVQL